MKSASPLTLAGDIATRLCEGVVRLDGRGKVRTLNVAARPWLRGLVAQNGRIMEWVATAQRGALTLPANIPLFEDCVDCPEPIPEVWLDRDGAGFALVIIPVPGDGEVGGIPRAERIASDVTLLMGAQVLDEIEEMRSLLDRFAQRKVALDEMTQQAANLSSLLGEIGDLAELRQRDLVFADERFSPSTLVGEILPGLPRQDGPESISYTVQEVSSVGQIYGDRGWMKRALGTLLGRMGEACPPGYRVQLQLRQIGDFVILAGSVGVDRTRSPGGGLSPGPGLPPPAKAVGFGLRMQVCKRIIKLHGGVLKAEFGHPVAGWPAELLPLESFNLSLPTGLPVEDRSRVSCANCRITNQAMEYARDLADLMARVQAAESATSTPKIDLHEQDTDR